MHQISSGIMLAWSALHVAAHVVPALRFFRNGAALWTGIQAWAQSAQSCALANQIVEPVIYSLSIGGFSLGLLLILYGINIAASQSRLRRQRLLEQRKQEADDEPELTTRDGGAAGSGQGGTRCWAHVVSACLCAARSDGRRRRRDSKLPYHRVGDDDDDEGL